MSEAGDWTLCLREPCPDCGGDVGTVGHEDLGRAITDAVAAFARTLAAADPHGVRARRSADAWSVLEYACHVRDLLGVFEHRVRGTLKTPGMALTMWDVDASAVNDSYNEQVPVLVAEEMAAMARSFVGVLIDLDAKAWDTAADRRGQRFTIRDLTRFVLHELIHHRWDAERSVTAGTPFI